MDTKTQRIVTQPALSKIPLNMVLRHLQEGLGKIYGTNRPSVLLYGSYARGEAKLDSDLDVLLIFPHKIQPGDEILRLGELLADLNLRYGMLVSVQPVTNHQYQNATGPFWRNVRKEGIVIDGI